MRDVMIVMVQVVVVVVIVVMTMMIVMMITISTINIITNNTKPTHNPVPLLAWQPLGRRGHQSFSQRHLLQPLVRHIPPFMF